MALTLRTTRKADLAEVDALLSRSYPKLLKDAYPPSVLVTALPLISRAQPLLVVSGTYYGAWDGNTLLGVGGWTRDRNKRGLGHVRHICTDAQVVRRGVGRALITHILNKAREAGLREMECWSTRNAVPFYARFGFKTRGPMEVPLQPGITFPSVRMHMVLA
ncbi:MAG: GNAT family N-acetyltransferase [Arenibacterium sp.]